jgi:hypothetical protein
MSSSAHIEPAHNRSLSQSHISNWLEVLGVRVIVEPLPDATPEAHNAVYFAVPETSEFHLRGFHFASVRGLLNTSVTGGCPPAARPVEHVRQHPAEQEDDRGVEDPEH